MDQSGILTGLIIGFLLGLTGMGGGSLLTPWLIMYRGISPGIAVGTDLVFSAVTRWFGAALYKRRRHVRVALVVRMAAGSVPGALLGVAGMHFLQKDVASAVGHVLIHLIGGSLLLSGGVIAIKCTPRFAHRRLKWNLGKPWRRFLIAFPSGLLIGFLVGITSAGSGALSGVILLMVFGLSTQETVGTEMYHAAILTTIAAAGHIWVKNVRYQLVGELLIGSLPGIWLGSRLSSKLPEQGLRGLLAVMLIITGLRIV